MQNRPPKRAATVANGSDLAGDHLRKVGEARHKGNADFPPHAEFHLTTAWDNVKLPPIRLS